VVSGNTSAATISIGEKLADMAREAAACGLLSERFWGIAKVSPQFLVASDRRYGRQLTRLSQFRAGYSIVGDMIAADKKQRLTNNTL
jgi:hypothetical protein